MRISSRWKLWAQPALTYEDMAPLATKHKSQSLIAALQDGRSPSVQILMAETINFKQLELQQPSSPARASRLG